MSGIVLITGAAGGIGTATAGAFARAGWKVVGLDQRKAADSSSMDHFIEADLGDVENARGAFSRIAGRYPRVDALVNNAAIQITKSLMDTTPEEWDAVMASNLRSAYLAVRHVQPLMKSHGGAIVNVSSVHALATSMKMAAYAATKGGLLALTRALAIELAPDRIRVNAVLPGAIDTPMLRAGFSRGHLGPAGAENPLEALGRRTVIGRVGKPEEVAQAILFLADSARSSFITGEALVVDGGATAKLSTE